MTVPSSTPAVPAALDLRVGPDSGRFRSAGASHPGRVRDHNEDAFHLDPDRGIFVVVDGLGGEAAGEKAAETALAFVCKRLERRTGTVEERLREAITLANNEIFRLARQNPAWNKMGCVLTAAVIEEDRATVGHVGDSRLYRIRGGRMEKVTHDHSPVGMREDEGELDESAAMTHPRRNEVFRTVGQDEHTPLDREFVEIREIPFEPDSAVLLCSDGLTDSITTDEIARVVEEHAQDPAAVVTGLVHAANAAGGRDNVTALFVAGERFGARSGSRARAGSPPSLLRRLGRPPYVIGLGVLFGILAFALLALIETRGPRRDAAVLPTMPPAAAPGVLNVGPGAPFATIGDALGRARAGDTVRVAPGTYRERVRLPEGVLLMAQSPRQSTLVAGEGPAPVPGEGAAPVAALVAEGVSSGRVVGLTIAGSASAPLDYGIVLRDADVAIEDVEISGARVAGIAIEGQSRGTVKGSLIHDNPGAGIAVRGPAAPRIAHNMIRRNGRGTTGPGIDLEPLARPEITGNLIAGNAAEGIRGIARAARRAVLADNVFVADGRRNGAGATSLSRTTAAPTPPGKRKSPRPRATK